MTLRESVARLHGYDLIYVCVNRERGKLGASGFCYIGKVKDTPDRYLDAEVMETFHHTIHRPGPAFRLALEPLKNEKQGKWFYGETGSNWKLPENEQKYFDGDEPWERLMIGIFESAASEYRLRLREALAEHHVDSEESFYMVLGGLKKRPRRPVGATETQIRKFLRRRGRHEQMLQALELLDTSMGKYIIQRIQDEELIRCTHPELDLISDPKERYKEADRLRAELVKERVKKKGEINI